MTRRTRSLAGLALVGILLTGCAASASDVQPIAGDAQSAARSAELGIGLERAGRSLPSTYRVLLEDMATQLADTITELEQLETADAAAESARVAALAASRDAIDAIHRAQSGEEGTAQRELHTAADALQELAGEQ